MNKVLEFLDGKKTYLCILVLMIFGVLDMKGLLPMEVIQYKDYIYTILLGGTGISMRMGVKSEAKKVENNVTQKLVDNNVLPPTENNKGGSK